MLPCEIRTLLNTAVLVRRSTSVDCASSSIGNCGSRAAAAPACIEGAMSASRARPLTVKAPIDLRFQAHRALFQICHKTPCGQDMPSKVDAHVALGGCEGASHVVAHCIGVNHGGVLGIGSLPLQTHVAADVDEVASRQHVG